jgi:hypothetical protein
MREKCKRDRARKNREEVVIFLGGSIMVAFAVGAVFELINNAPAIIEKMEKMPALLKKVVDTNAQQRQQQ